VCNLLLDTGAELFDWEDGDTLEGAAQRGLADIVRRLLGMGMGKKGDSAYSHDTRGTALRLAAEAGHTAVCEILVADGADPSVLQKPLLAAIARHDEAVARNICRTGLVPEAAKAAGRQKCEQVIASMHVIQQVLGPKG